ncbi:potassium-transporting ATPase subunit KdpC [Azonexus sp.]|uniref:potassium-transporting ATPase subunit KdpC n=1 Tax=Azonexus sp. TaxID=1872668 RepID=UPI0039E30B65
MLKELKPALVVFGLLTLITGAAYPALITGLAQTVFPAQANGSLIVEDGKVRGSRLIGQAFSDTRHFWGRPSATGPMPFNAAASGAANLGPLNPALEDALKTRIAALKASDPEQHTPIPVDLVSSSGSGLDPHISVAAALWQAPRIARHNDLTEKQVRELIAQHTEERQFGFLGEARVNVLTLNLTLDRLPTQR